MQISRINYYKKNNYYKANKKGSILLTTFFIPSIFLLNNSFYCRCLMEVTHLRPGSQNKFRKKIFALIKITLKKC